MKYSIRALEPFIQKFPAEYMVANLLSTPQQGLLLQAMIINIALDWRDPGIQPGISTWE